MTPRPLQARWDVLLDEIGAVDIETLEDLCARIALPMGKKLNETVNQNLQRTVSIRIDIGAE